MTFRISTHAGRLLSFAWKNKSILVRKQPFSSFEINVWASGSSFPSSWIICLNPWPTTLSLVVEEVVDVVCDILVCTTIAFLVAMIVSCSVSKIPWAWYVVWPAVVASELCPATPALVFIELEVSLNSTSPVLNLGILDWPLNL